MSLLANNKMNNVSLRVQYSPPLVKTDLKDGNILANLDLPMQPQLTLIKHHYCLLIYAQVQVNVLPTFL